MVFKQPTLQLQRHPQFENDVKMYGIQTRKHGIKHTPEFENDVKMYGIQTVKSLKNMVL